MVMIEMILMMMLMTVMVMLTMIVILKIMMLTMIMIVVTMMMMKIIIYLVNIFYHMKQWWCHYSYRMMLLRVDVWQYTTATTAAVIFVNELMCKYNAI